MYTPQTGPIFVKQFSALFDAVLEASPGGMAVLDARGHLLGADDVFLNLIGYARGDMPGLPLQCLFPHADDALATAEDTGVWWDEQGEVIRKDGEVVGALVSMTPARGPQETTVGFVVRARRVPAEGTRMAARRASVPRRRLEHQLRNVLTIIAGNIDLIDRAAEDQSLRHRLELVQTALRSAMEILDRMQRDSIR